MKTQSNSAEVPAVVRALMSAHGLGPGALRSDGRLTLTFEDRYRVHLDHTPARRLALSAIVLDLSHHMEDAEVTQLLQTLTARGTGLLQSRATTLSLDTARRRVLLQQTFSVDVDLQRMEFELAEFVAALAFWTQSGIAQEAGNV